MVYELNIMSTIYTTGFLRCFRDLIQVPIIENRVPRIRENYYRVARIRENWVVPTGPHWVLDIFL